MISESSVLNAVVFYSGALLLVCLLYWVTPVLRRGGVFVLLLVAAFASVRLVLPVEIPITHVFRSWDFLGAILRFLIDHPEFTELLVIVWVIGALVSLGYNLYILRCTDKECAEYEKVKVTDESVKKVAKQMSIPCEVVVSPIVPIPFAVGFLNHTIYLPDLRLSERDTGFVLAHEAQHIRSHDALIKLFFGGVTVIMWWNPIAHWFRRAIDALLEYRCDAKVTANMDEKEQLAYVRMLKNLTDRLLPNKRVSALALNESLAVSKKNLMIRRCNILLKGNANPSRPVRIMVQIALVALFCASYLIIFQPAVLAPEENFQNDARTSYDESYVGRGFGDGVYSAFILKSSDGRYQLFVDYEFNRYLTYDEVMSDKYQDLFIFEEGIQK